MDNNGFGDQFLEDGLTKNSRSRVQKVSVGATRRTSMPQRSSQFFTTKQSPDLNSMATSF